MILHWTPILHGMAMSGMCYSINDSYLFFIWKELVFVLLVSAMLVCL